MSDKVDGEAMDGKSSDREKANEPVKDPRAEMPPAARRALAEAEERRAAASRSQESEKREINGRGGLDPARYGDWEKKGIAVDF